MLLHLYTFPWSLGYWEWEDDDARFLDSSVWNLEAN